MAASAAKEVRRGFDPAWELSDEGSILLSEAEQLLVQDCMESDGFEYWVWGVPNVDDLQGDAYLLIDVEWAREHGYDTGRDDRLEELWRDDPNSAYANALPKDEGLRYSQARHGTIGGPKLTADLPGGGQIEAAADGCTADAKDSLYGDFAVWFQAEKASKNLGAIYLPDLFADDRFVAAREQWSACMRDAGHDYPDPPAIREDLAERVVNLTSREASALEVELAVAEATCATTTPFADTVRDLEVEYRGEYGDEYHDELTAYQQLAEAALVRAEQIVGTAGQPVG